MIIFYFIVNIIFANKKRKKKKKKEKKERKEMASDAFVH